MRSTGSNHFQSSEFDLTGYNQFISTPTKSATDVEKDQLIAKLQAKNEMLRKEISRIDEVLAEPIQQKTRYGINIDNSRSDIANKQLDNAYKQIRGYEYEIKRLRASKDSGSYVEQIKKTELILKEKEELSSKLKKELADLKKESMEITKMLKNDNQKEFYENKSSKYGTQIKFLREKEKELQNKIDTRQANFQKQTVFIKKLQKQLQKAGMKHDAIQAIKDKYYSGAHPYSTYYGSNVSKMTLTSRIESQRQQFVEDRTPQAFKALQNEKKLLEKMDKDYQSQLNKLQLEKQEMCVKNLRVRNKLVEVQDQIDRVEMTINNLKQYIDPKKLKPQNSITRNTQSVGRYGDVNRSLSAITSAFNPMLKTLEFGKVSKNGKKFTDRAKLGKAYGKIIAIDLYENKTGSSNIVGIQATYDIKGVIKKSSPNSFVDLEDALKKTVTLFDSEDYFKEVELICNEKGLIIGVSFMSLKKIPGRAGAMNGNRRSLNLGPNQYPACLYGSFNSQGLELLGVEVQEQGKK